MTIRFLLNGELRREAALSPTMTLLDYLRERAGLTGTKEGCGEGDCGACTVVLVGADGGREAVNACLLVMGQLDGAAIVTVEGLAGSDGALDPVQQAMVDSDGTQCGYCTPGFVMSLHALGGEALSEEAVHDALAGNLCRCTGYRPIVAAAMRSGTGQDRVAPGAPDAADACHHGGQSFFAPTDLAALLDLRSRHADATLLAGGTDLGLIASKERRAIPTIIHTRRVRELTEVREDDEALEIGAAVTYSDALPFIDRLDPSFAALIRRIGSRQIRNSGTIGGNIANASPIGDTPPCLMALDASLVLASPGGERQLPIGEFFVAYRRTALRPDEVLRAIRIPKPADDEHFRAYKVSKRHDQDISSVIGAYRLTVTDGRITDARIAYGGMAATSKRASAAEAALKGSVWNEDAARAAATALARDFDPISDHRASADYRRRVAANLMLRLHRDLSGGEEALQVMAL